MAFEKEIHCRANVFLSATVLQYCFSRRAHSRGSFNKARCVGLWCVDVGRDWVCAPAYPMDEARENKSPFQLCSRVACPLCLRSDQSSLWGAGSPCNVILDQNQCKHVACTSTEPPSGTKCLKKPWKRFGKSYYIVCRVLEVRGRVQSP